MCDYSRHDVASRPAKPEQVVVTTRFVNSVTQGFSAIEEPGVAVRLLPGTKLSGEVVHQYLD
jgi:hypothetical protein